MTLPDILVAIIGTWILLGLLGTAVSAILILADPTRRLRFKANREEHKGLVGSFFAS